MDVITVKTLDGGETHRPLVPSEAADESCVSIATGGRAGASVVFGSSFMNNSMFVRGA